MGEGLVERDPATLHPRGMRAKRKIQGRISQLYIMDGLVRGAGW